MFQPLEETARTLFSKSMSQPKVNPTELSLATRVLSTAIAFHVYLGLILVSFGPHFASLFIQIIAGPKWAATDASSALAAYCVLIPVLGVNGITEAFVHSVATRRELFKMTWWMVAFFVVYSTVGIGLLAGVNAGTSGTLESFCSTMNVIVFIIMICFIMMSITTLSFFIYIYIKRV